MPRKQHKYHFIYKTTNLKNGNFYIGMHSTSNLEDGYLGSGNRLRRAIRKHGKENFKLEILELFESRENLANREKELVNEDLLKDPMCMNLKLGGEGGWHIYATIAFREKLKDPVFKSEFAKKTADSNYRRVAQGEIFTTPNWNGKKHREETKNKIGLANSIKQMGEKNSQFGTYWITNGIDNKKVKNDFEIPIGWYKGRKTK
jgi:group I intron endonuclease